jgi:hypothetical protein
MTAAIMTPPADEIVPSKREIAYNRFLSHHSDSERYDYLSQKLEAMGAIELSVLAARWSREHKAVAADLRKRCR